MKYTKKQVTIEAVQLPQYGNYNLDEFHKWADENGFSSYESGRDENMIIPTLEGDMVASPGDWIIKGLKGEFYPCKPDIFTMSYEPFNTEIKLPSQFQIGEEVNFYPHMSISLMHVDTTSALRSGIIEAVRFTNSKVFYEIREGSSSYSWKDILSDGVLKK